MLQVFLLAVEGEENKNKFMEIYLRYKNLMYTVAYNILHNHEIAEEAVQDTLFKLTKYISTIENVESKRTRNYIMIITRNISFDIYNKEKKYCETSDDNSVYINDEPFTADILDYVISEEGYKHLLEIIEKMDYSFKDTLKLKILYEHTNDEIAELQGISKRAVEMRLYRGRAIIKELLMRECDDYATK